MILQLVFAGIWLPTVLWSGTHPPSRDMVRAAIGPGGPFAQALKMYCLDVGCYPASLDGSLTLPANLRNPASWKGPYLEAEEGLIDPWGHPYLYCSPGKQNVDSYDLWSPGRDGYSGTEDDICNWKRADE